MLVFRRCINYLLSVREMGLKLKSIIICFVCLFVSMASINFAQAGFFSHVKENLDKAAVDARKTGRKVGVKVDEGSKDARKTGREVGVKVDEGSKDARKTGREVGVKVDGVTNDDNSNSSSQHHGHHKGTVSTFVEHTTSGHIYRVSKADKNWRVVFNQKTHVRHYTGGRITPYTESWQQPDNKITTVRNGQWLELQLKNGTWVVMAGANHR